MELRKTEQEVNSIAAAYESLHRRDVLSVAGQEVLVDLSSLPVLAGSQERTVLEESQSEKAEQCDSDASRRDSAGARETGSSIGMKEALIELESIRHRLEELRNKADRFRQRLSEKDPVTNNPRYGEKTALRVTKMLALFDSLNMAIGVAFGEENGHVAEKNEEDCIVRKIRLVVKEEDAAFEKSQKDAAVAEADEASRREEETRQQEEMKRLAEKAALEEKRRKEVELHQQAVAARQERELREAMEAQAAKDADRAFVDSIKKGPDGVREQLSNLRDGTASDPKAYSVAIGSLHTIFSQITAHPEESKFRRIRRDHPKFDEDIGRHPGGKEILIAAGFQLATLDGVPCFLSKEPDIEHDMNGWSDWFNSLKSTLEIIEEALLQ